MASLPCEFCGSSDAVEAYPDGDFCFSCNRKLNTEKRLQLIQDYKKQKNPKEIKLASLTNFWREWLKNRGIKQSTINKFDLQYDELSGSIAYPLRIKGAVVGYQLRDKSKQIKTIRYAADDKPFLFECRSDNTESVVVVEDPVSAMKIWQEADINTVALLGTNLNCTNKLFLIEEYKKIVIWMDGDLAGYKAAQKISNDLSQFCETFITFTKQDPKDLEASNITPVLSIG
jgi:5S rRNA maturation endonuclease (ribonuclease M5)